MPHIIVLLQSTHHWASRTYLEYESIDDCMDALCRIFEGFMRLKNLYVDNKNYLLELFNFLDTLEDISCVVMQGDSNMYTPHNKLWIKEQLFLRLDRLDCDGMGY
ncbi:protein enhancer of rudimentary [Drosophila mojavensis]|uniref:Enhancer of rudimentary homolog n=1 Tax=Drosophila mojavensis TaxID=7230 RepID=B4KFL5_DROMO|nr:protein enhancer of rudimentary [Drosophila mojavensis]EDW13130.1 uncharacterized protein Dmoj_GI21527 [Drosophila mojavensis]